MQTPQTQGGRYVTWTIGDAALDGQNSDKLGEKAGGGWLLVVKSLPWSGHYILADASFLWLWLAERSGIEGPRYQGMHR